MLFILGAPLYSTKNNVIALMYQSMNAKNLGSFMDKN